MPYDLDNSRLLLRAIFWAAQKESLLYHWFCDNPVTDCAYYPKSGLVAIMNNSSEQQVTRCFNGDGRARRVAVKPYESRWLKAWPTSPPNFTEPTEG